jgi:hypothetical protein
MRRMLRVIKVKKTGLCMPFILYHSRDNGLILTSNTEMYDLIRDMIYRDDRLKTPRS